MADVQPDAAALRAQLQHVLWIGGASAAGKTTIARRIAEQNGLMLYATDDAMSDHARRATPETCPFLSEFMEMDMDERWLRRSPEAMLETFPWFRGEAFDMIFDDVLRLPRTPGVIVEGFRLLPHRVQPLLAAPSHAVWLLPTPDFRRAASAQRAPAWGFLDETSDPEQALRNLLERDRMFTDRLREETTRLELPAIEVDVPTNEGEIANRVTEAFGL
ncbi:MAG: hypothetical protein ACRDV7_02265 [Acidimicrobiia bacterium]